MASPKNSNFRSRVSPTTATTTPVLMPISLLPVAVEGQATPIAPTSRRRSMWFVDQQLESDPSRATASSAPGENGVRELHAQHPVSENVPSRAPASGDSLDSNVSSRAQLPPPVMDFQLRSEPPVQSLLAKGRRDPEVADLSEGAGRVSSPTELPSPALSATATSISSTGSIGPTPSSSHFGGSTSNHRLGKTGSIAEESRPHDVQREHDVPERQSVGPTVMQEAPSPSLLNDEVHLQVNEPYEKSSEGDAPAGLRSLPPAPGNVEAKATTALHKANGTTTVEPCDGAAFARGRRVTCESSRAIVPYTGGEGAAAQLPKRQQYSFTYDDHHSNSTGFDPVLSRLSALPPTSLVSEAGPSVNSPSRAWDLTTFSSTSNCSGSHPGTPPETASTPQNPEQRPDWVVVSVAQAEQAARKLRDQVNKTNELEVTVKKHKRERVLLYDAAMKQAAKRQEEGISEAKQTFEREEGVMRETVDKELRKINDLYQERCRDYAQMVSDECEGEVSKSSADLRKDWARQKKTIDQLVRGGGEEDRRVEVIARAVTEQLQEERKDELAAIRAEICSDVKLEFESREEALRDTLETEFQADLDGQLLLAEIRHQKEIEQLRAALSVRGTPCAEAASGKMVVYNGVTRQKDKKGEGSSDAPPPGSPSPSLSRRPLQPKNRVGLAAAGSGVAASLREAAAESRKTRLGTKLPAFKPPSQKVWRGKDDKTPKTAKTAKMPSTRSGSTATPNAKVQAKTKLQAKVKVQDKPKVQTKKPRPASLGRRAKNTVKTTTAKTTAQDTNPDDAETSAGDKEDKDLDEGITSALTVSPVKATAGDIFTPSTDNEGDSSVQPLRPKKRTKRLFSASL